MWHLASPWWCTSNLKHAIKHGRCSSVKGRLTWSTNQHSLSDWQRFCCLVVAHYADGFCYTYAVSLYAWLCQGAAQEHTCLNIETRHSRLVAECMLKWKKETLHETWLSEWTNAFTKEWTRLSGVCLHAIWLNEWTNAWVNEQIRLSSLWVRVQVSVCVCVCARVLHEVWLNQWTNAWMKEWARLSRVCVCVCVCCMKSD